MLRKGDKEITGMYIGSRVITSVYIGAKLVWTAISSCFGSGYWRGDKPWSRTDGWRRNK